MAVTQWQSSSLTLWAALRDWFVPEAATFLIALPRLSWPISIISLLLLLEEFVVRKLFSSIFISSEAFDLLDNSSKSLFCLITDSLRVYIYIIS